MIKAQVIAHSVAEDCLPLISVEALFPRIVNAEVLRHRVFSFSSASSRAIPVHRMFEAYGVAAPVRFGREQPGMQDLGAHDGLICHPDTGVMLTAEQAWRCASEDARQWAQAFATAGYHKQVCNRITEPYQHIRVLITSCRWANWDALRLHDDADPTIAALAHAILEARELSTPRTLNHNEWHLPYVTDEERSTQSPSNLRRMSAARCARVSHRLHDGASPTLEKDLALFERLMGASPVHASPTEHQACPDGANGAPQLHGNLTGWVQFRKLLPGEVVLD